jgi:hypothetical protein
MRVLSVAVFYLCSAIIFSQTSRSQICGSDRDPSGAVLSGATVTPTNEGTGEAQRQVTTDAGVHAFPAILSGPLVCAWRPKGVSDHAAE